jgi:transcriptional regulator with XRE-family HTH domain
MSWFRSNPDSEAVLAEERLLLSATEAVEEAMVRAGKNRQQLAELLNVRPTEVSQRLSGRRNLTLRTLARMLHVLGMRVELRLKPALPTVKDDSDEAETCQLARAISISLESLKAFEPLETHVFDLVGGVLFGSEIRAAWPALDEEEPESSSYYLIDTTAP